MHTYISGCTYDLYAVAIVSTAATDVGMHGTTSLLVYIEGQWQSYFTIPTSF